MRLAQSTLEPYPSLQHVGFLHDAEKEYVEARVVIALVTGSEVPDLEQLDTCKTCGRAYGIAGFQLVYL